MKKVMFFALSLTLSFAGHTTSLFAMRKKTEVTATQQWSTELSNVAIADDCFSIIFSFLPYKELIKLKRINKAFFNLFNTQVFTFTPPNTTTNDTIFNTLPHSLHTINLLHCYSITSQGFITFFKTRPHLIRLDLAFTNIDDTALNTIPPTIQVIDLGSKNSTSSKGLIEFFKTHPNLKTIILRFIKDKITDAVLYSLPPSVKNVNLAGCHSITPQGLIQFLKTHPNLTNINLRHLKIDDTTLDALPPSVKVIKLFGCKSITSQAKDRLRQRGIEVAG